ncbi:MAG: vWA domain-containing protein [Candidatus Paceibacterota bacterium]
MDNDCDGEVDGDARGPVARWCYDQNIPAETTLSSPCVRGVQVCSIGNWQECAGAVSPMDEVGLLACDGIDNNCDGCLDGILTTEGCQPINPEGFDIVYAIDTSGSMDDKIEAVRDATVSFSALYGSDPSFRFSIVLVPGEVDGEAQVLIPLSPFAVFSSVLSSSDITSTSGSSEPSWDVVYELGTEELAVNWRTGTVRIIILFTDERGQSFRSPRAIAEIEMCRGLTHGEFLAYVVLPFDTDDWDLCGEFFELTPDPEAMTAALQRIIRDPCLD